MYQLIGGYEDANNSSVLRHDPIYKLACDRLPEAGEHLWEYERPLYRRPACGWQGYQDLSLGCLEGFSIRSYISTLNKQGLNVLDALKQVFLGNPTIPTMIQPE